MLATPGTVARDYTRELIRNYAAHCEVTLAGSSLLAPLAEAFMHGRAVEDAAIAREIAPAFVSTEKGRTDCIVLACTHYPLLLSHFERLAPWAVAWIDPAPAEPKLANQATTQPARTIAPHNAAATFTDRRGFMIPLPPKAPPEPLHSQARDGAEFPDECGHAMTQTAGHQFFQSEVEERWL